MRGRRTCSPLGCTASAVSPETASLLIPARPGQQAPAGQLPGLPQLARRRASTRSPTARACPPAGSALNCRDPPVTAFATGTPYGTDVPRAAAKRSTVRSAWLVLVVAGLDEVGGAFGDHDGGRLGMAADDLWHDRGVHHPQPGQAADAQLAVDHRGIVAAH